MPRRKVPKHLPASTSEWWGDAEKHTGPVETLKPKGRCKWEQDGPNMARCESCPLKHGMYLKPGLEVRGGKIVAKRPIQF